MCVFIFFAAFAVLRVIESAMEQNNQNSESVKEENRQLNREGERAEENGGKFGDGPGQHSVMESSPPSQVEAELQVSQSETLGLHSPSHLQSDFVTSSHSLHEVPAEYELQPNELTESKSQLDASHKQSLPTQSNLSAPTPILNSSEPRNGPALRIVRTPSTDGYNWRKYGQKQVKIPQGYRSYYKCTYSQCYAKKIECCDHRHVVIEVIYKGQHSHEPPRKVNYARETGPALSVDKGNVRNLASSSKEPKEEMPKLKRQNSSGSTANAQIIVKEQHIGELEPKQRVKKSSSECTGALLKPNKKPKFVVHAADDVGISGDGYRWRKYGQKMVKGNPHPRNYYRCTSAGCLVRKHIERAVDNSSALVITYKGKHDHDMPVPKKRHGPPSPCLVAAAAPASMNNDMQFKKTEPSPLPPNQETATHWSVDMEGELRSQALDLGGEKAIESARTLLSIGFEIKPC